MSINFERLSRVMMALGMMAIASACDPCRDLGEKLCDCLYASEMEKRQCKTSLNTAKAHKFFQIARDPKVCEEARKNCLCTDLLAGEDQQCGQYRSSFEE